MSSTVELRLLEDADGLEGSVLEDGRCFHVDPRVPEEDWRRRIPVGRRAVEIAVESYLVEPGLAERGLGVPA